MSAVQPEHIRALVFAVGIKLGDEYRDSVLPDICGVATTVSFLLDGTSVVCLTYSHGGVATEHWIEVTRARPMRATSSGLSKSGEV